MRMLTAISTGNTVFIPLLLAAALTYANPREALPITKVLFQDSVHWTIEFNIREIGIFGKPPNQTDTITLGCASPEWCTNPDTNNSPMHQCAIPIQIDTAKNTGFITPQHYPGLKLRPKYTIFMGIKNGKYLYYGPTLPEKLQPITSITLNITRTTCSDVFDGVIESYPCTRSEYLVSTCQSEAPRKGYISAILTDHHQGPLRGFMVYCYSTLASSLIKTTQTDGYGMFYINDLDTCSLYSLLFKKNTFQTEYLIKPKNTYPQTDDSISIQYPPTSVNKQQSGAEKKAPAVRLLSPSKSNGNLLVIKVADQSLSGEGTCELFSLSGKLIRSLSISFLGTGTYTIAWDGTDHKGRQINAGTYLCRIKIGSELLCRNFITR